MKNIENKQTTIPSVADYRELINVVVNAAPQGGMTMSDMRSRLRIIDAVEKSNGENIALEDADYDTLLTCLDAMRWAIVDRQIVDFEDAVKAARSV